MAILNSTDTPTVQEVRYEVFPTLTAEEIPDAVITRRTIWRYANRSILALVKLTETAYSALQATDPKRQAMEEACIKRCAHDLIPTIAQIVRDNENGIMSQYQEIDWVERRKILENEINDRLKPYVPDAVKGEYPYAVSRRKAG